jgi:putative membrane protein
MARPGRRGFRSAQDADPNARVEIQRALIDAERIMMQTVQTSLSLIGFGFTIAEFFNGKDLPVHSAPRARLVGESLLVLGLLLLAMGIWTHSRYRRRLVRDLIRAGAGRQSFGVRLSDTPSFLVAILLLLVGLLTLVSILFRWLL